MHCVIGSGPSGVACSRALLDRGLSVHMLDAGFELESERAERVAAMSLEVPAEWTPEDLAFIGEGMAPDAGGVPLKLLYGSDFPYRQAELLLHIDLSGVGVKPSLAKGGLSNVWGAAMLPYIDADLPDWPFDAARLARHYRAVTAITGLSAVSDDLEARFPLFADRPDTLELSRQAGRLHRHWEAHRMHLNRAGVSFGRSRLAVAGFAGPASPGCVRCGLCMYGCPYGLIYNSASTLERLRQHPRFTYQPDFIAESVSETTTSATIVGRSRLGGEQTKVVCDRAYLAAGALASTKLVLHSMSAYERPLLMKDSQYFLIPLVLARGVKGVREEHLHTLSQLYLELHDRSVSPYTVHLQLYTYSDLIGSVVHKAFGPLAGVLGPVVRHLEGRLVILQGYLHSAHSGTIRVELRGNGSTHEPLLQVTGQPRPAARRSVRKLLRKLVRLAPQLGALPIWPMAKIAEPGRGFHTGGTFPMREHPGEFESDVLGRPAAWRRVHVVDASVLPSIAATTITFTVMANAHRIGWESADL